MQHLALLSLDEKAGERVNLIDCDKPRDIYTDVALLVQILIEQDKDKDAAYWRAAFKKMNARQIRKLIKRPAMTFAYGAGNASWSKHIKEEYSAICPGAEIRARRLPSQEDSKGSNRAIAWASSRDAAALANWRQGLPGVTKYSNGKVPPVFPSRTTTGSRKCGQL